MTAITKPDFENIWATEGGIGAPSLEQILSGWKQNQFPPSEISNFLQNKVETAIKYIFQYGLSEWSKDIEYQTNSLVLYAGKHWICKRVNTNKPPVIGLDWTVAFDAYGASADLRVEVQKILNQDGYLKHYVRKADPVMTARAKAPSFESDVGVTSGYWYKNYQTGMSSTGGDLIFMTDGKVGGRIKKDATISESDPNVLVTMGMLKDFIEAMTKAVQIPVGFSIITNNKKPPSDPAQLGYGTWVLDVQGKALVGVSTENAINVPEWTKDADSVFGEYTHTMTIAEIAKHRDTFPADDQLIAQFDLERNPNLVGRRYDATSSTSKDYESGWAYLPYVGESKPFNVVQPSQTKFIWTRTA